MGCHRRVSDERPPLSSVAVTYNAAAYGPTTYMVATDSPSGCQSYGDGVDPVAALEELPEPYGPALTLDAAGLDPTAIAERLDLPLDAVSTLLEVGCLKLAALLSTDEPNRRRRRQSSGCEASSARDSTPSLKKMRYT